MLMPKKVKYRKQMRGRRNGKAWRGGDLAFGEYGLKAMECAWITDRQIEASRVADYAVHQAWREIVDSGFFPDKPFHQEASGNPHGQRAKARRRNGCRS